MKLSPIAAACALSFACSSVALAQDISGVVKNAKGQPVANANVVVVNSKYTTKTDSNGKFVISGLNAGNVEFDANVNPDEDIQIIIGKDYQDFLNLNR